MPANASLKSKKGIKVNSYFVPEGSAPFDLFDYDIRKSSIKNPGGEVVFEMSNVEVPTGWSQVATDILAQKYFRRTGVPQTDGTTGAETSVKQVVHRLADCWRVWGERYGYFASREEGSIFYNEIVYTLLAQIAAPNSPQWFNTGLYNSYKINGSSQGHYYVDPDDEQLKVSGSSYERPQTHACFILSVNDDLVNEGGIMDLLVKEARIFKYGSGAGTNYSNIRATHERLSGGGFSSGLMSFLKVTDKAAGAIKSGGTTRRAAKMVCVDLDHPEITELVNWKLKEEEKVAALVAAGFSSDYEGEAYQTVSGQNVNLSVRIPNQFFQNLKDKRNWGLTSRTSKEVIKEVNSSELWDQIAHAAWKCGDPGVQFDTTINEWHTCPEGGRIRASNPCSEFMFLDNTGCNLASINLRKFWDYEKGIFNVKAFEHTCKIWSVVLEITTLMAQYPTKEIAQLSYEYRPVGLGFANLGGMLMAAGIPYDSEKGRSMAGVLSSIMTGTVYKTSAEMASVLGPFKHFNVNKNHMLKVMRNHRAAAFNDSKSYSGLTIKPEGIKEEFCPEYLVNASCRIWDDAVELGEKYGYRNAQATVVAPTGTIGLLMDCDTTGIEPDFSLVKFKKLSGGGYFKIINNAVPSALVNLGYSEYEIKNIKNYILGRGTFAGAPYINHETLMAKGFSKSDVKKLDELSQSAFHINYLFNAFTLGEDCMRRIGIEAEKYNDPGFNLLQQLGFTPQQIEEANKYICGTMTIEGAPHLKDEDLPVFDCANKCGPEGKRFLSPLSHIQMMASVQPFISGAISKTINFPAEADAKDIKDNFELAWRKGLKACTVYRDGSKLSQPLSSSDKKNEQKKDLTESELIDCLTPEQVLKAAQKIIHESSDTKFKRALSRVVEKKSLPDKRNGFTQKAKIDGHAVYIRTGEYDDGTLGEIFIDMYKEGASYRSLLNCFAVAVSVGLQYGVPLEEFVEKFTFTRFEPAGMVEGQPYIKYSTSLLDLIFRTLAWEYLGREDLLHVKPGKAQVTENLTMPDCKESKEISYQLNTSLSGQTQDFLSSMMGDAPVCNVCGHITIRNGTCYKCLNCGNSLGCS
ncbi:MAG: adenosylcobalamin-dependent ribonucleoside-diphosphate reductase [Cytophagaceae bacterium]